MTAFAVARGLVYPLVLQHRGVSPSLAGLNAGAFAAGLAAGNLRCRPPAPSDPLRYLVVFGLAGCALSLATFATFDTLWVWSIARFTLGFCASIVFVLSEAWLNTACPDRLRGRVSGLYGMDLCGGFAAGPLAIPFFGTDDGFAFASLAVYVALVAFVTVVLSRRARTQPERVAPGEMLKFFVEAPLRVGMICAFAFADVAATSGMPVYFVRIGYSEAFAATSVTVLERIRSPLRRTFRTASVSAQVQPIDRG
ncbi:MFS transporter [Rhizobium laguerreae]|uniref:MFS transporter n=1 Tax=Rhizobium laguerreae TaxID=1076926 RepID=UPI00103F785B|nr:MFS transporter [Rhizobium laguerreae]TBX98344.1 MFS transporter [Rhizobium laguerreae]